MRTRAPATSHGGPALHWAVAGGRPETVKLLPDKGAEAHARDGEDQTALVLAEARGRDEIAEVLRGAGGRRVGVIGDSA